MSTTEARQQARNTYTRALVARYPEPTDRIRIQAIAMLDTWWPGTEEQVLTAQTYGLEAARRRRSARSGQ